MRNKCPKCGNVFYYNLPLVTCTKCGISWYTFRRKLSFTGILMILIGSASLSLTTIPLAILLIISGILYTYFDY